ncbi:hypothetical protein ACOMHN_029884 [Nucella lapillus]
MCSNPELKTSSGTKADPDAVVYPQILGQSEGQQHPSDQQRTAASDQGESGQLAEDDVKTSGDQPAQVREVVSHPSAPAATDRRQSVDSGEDQRPETDGPQSAVPRHQSPDPSSGESSVNEQQQSSDWDSSDHHSGDHHHAHDDAFSQLSADVSHLRVSHAERPRVCEVSSNDLRDSGDPRLTDEMDTCSEDAASSSSSSSSPQRQSKDDSCSSSAFSDTRGQSGEDSSGLTGHGITEESDQNGHSVTERSDQNCHNITEESDQNGHSITEESDQNSHRITEESDQNSHRITEESDQNSHRITEESDQNSHRITEESDQNSHRITEESDKNSHRITEESDQNSRSITEESDQNSHSITEESDQNSHSITEESDQNSHSITEESDQNCHNITEENDKSTSSTDQPDKGSPPTSVYLTPETERGPAKDSAASLSGDPSRASSLEASATNSDPSGTNSDGSHPDCSVEHRPYNGDLSCSSSEDDKRPKEMNHENNHMPFFVPSPYFNNQHPMFQFPPPSLYINRGRGHYIHGQQRGSCGNVPDFFVPQTNGTYLGYKLNRTEVQQGNAAYGAGHANGQTCLSDMPGDQLYKTWNPRNPRGRPMVVSSAYLRRGRGGLLLRGRGGFGGGGGGGRSGSRPRMAECRFPCAQTFRRRSNSRLNVDHFPRRRMHERHSRDWPEQREDSGVYGKARNGDMAPWDSPNNGFSRGRTPFRTNLNQAANRHRSAPPAHSMRVSDGMHYRARQRHRSLSRSPRHAGGPRNSQHVQGGQVWWQYSPPMSRRHYNEQESYTPQRNYGSNMYRWTRQTAWHRRQNFEKDDYSRRDGSSVRVGRHYFNQQNNARFSRQNDCELSYQQHSASTEQREADNLDGQGTAPKTVIVVPQETHHQNGPQMPQHLEQEAANSSTQDETSMQSTDRDSSGVHNSSDPPSQNEQPSRPQMREGHCNANYHGQWQTNRTQYRRRPRDGSNTAHWRGMNGSVSPRRPGRPRAAPWWQEPQTPRCFQQRNICRQQNGATGVRQPERHVEYDHKGINTKTLPKGVAGWNGNDAGEFPPWSNVENARMAGSPPFPGGEGLHADFVRKVMEVLRDQQVDPAEADQALQTLTRMRLPSDAGQNLNNVLVHHIRGRRVQSSNRTGRILRPCTLQNNDQQKYPPSARQQESYHYDDGTSRNQNVNVSFSVVPQGNDVSHPGNYMNGTVSPPHAQHMSQTNAHEVQPESYTNSALHRHRQPGRFPGNQRQFHAKEKQQWRSKSQTQYVYFLDNQDQNTGARPDMQNNDLIQNLNPTWSQQNVNRFPGFCDVNGNLQTYVPVANGYNQNTFQQPSGQDNSCPSYVDQARRPALRSAQPPQLVVREGRNGNYEVSELQQNLDNKSALETHEIQANGAHITHASSGFDTTGHQNASDHVNGNAVLNLSDERLQVPVVPNGSQPVHFGMGNFLPQGTPLRTPMLPVQLQPVNTQLLQPVNTPMFHPVQTPFIPTMDVPYPQQNVFQFPSPLPFFPVGNPGQVCSAPNVFQFPDPSQHPLPVDMSQGPQLEVQPQSSMDKPYGFAGNIPLVQFPPPNNSLPPNQVHVDNAARVGDVNGNDC